MPYTASPLATIAATVAAPASTAGRQPASRRGDGAGVDRAPRAEVGAARRQDHAPLQTRACSGLKPMR